MTAVFQILNKEGVRYGKEGMEAGESGIQPGLLVKLQTDNTCDLCTAAEKPTGFAFGTRLYEYRPTTKVFDSGEVMAMVQGAGLALLSVDFFSSGSLPSVQDQLYSAASGKIATSGSYKFGECQDIVTHYQAISGIGSAQSLALIRYNFDAFD